MERVRRAPGLLRTGMAAQYNQSRWAATIGCAATAGTDRGNRNHRHYAV